MRFVLDSRWVLLPEMFYYTISGPTGDAYTTELPDLVDHLNLNGVEGEFSELAIRHGDITVQLSMGVGSITITRGTSFSITLELETLEELRKTFAEAIARTVHAWVP